MTNTREYEWADITVVLGGRDVTGLRAVEYGAKQEKELLHGKGNRPHSIQCGNVTYEGKVSLTQSEYETLRLAMGGNILNGSLTLVVSYGNPAKGDTLVTDILTGVQFTEDATKWKQGDKFQEKELPFLYLSEKRG